MDSNPTCEIVLGSMLVSLLDPTPGEEVAFHRWYERDHFYAGVMVGPWFFSGRRFVATRALKDLRFPAQTPLLADLRQGSFLTLYWILAGKHDEAVGWSIEQVQQLIANDRMIPSRRPAHAGFYRYAGGVFRDADGVPAELALEHLYAGLALVLTEPAPGVDPAALARWYREEQLPRALRGSAAAMALAFETMPLPAGVPSYIPRRQGLERSLLHVYFLEQDPRACWKELFEPLPRALEKSGLGRVSFAAPFVPTVPGTDRYCDEL